MNTIYKIAFNKQSSFAQPESFMRKNIISAILFASIFSALPGMAENNGLRNDDLFAILLRLAIHCGALLQNF
jgi:hypothetical protein